MALADKSGTALGFMVTSEQGKRSGRKLSNEERGLWADMTRSVTPLRPGADNPISKSGERASHPVPRAAERPRAKAAKEAPPVAPMPRREKQRLARGKAPIGFRADLHGKTQSEAHAYLLRSLRRAQADGAKFVLVVTGKGDRFAASAGERGVLRRQVPLWLNLPEFRRYVIAFDEADAVHGGAGALYVQLRRMPPAPAKE
jgi:DNA-nicking Smr family endonuclease